MKTFTNAALVEIAKPGPLDRNGDPGKPTPVWEGAARGYLKRTRRQIVSGGVSMPLIRDVFTILRSAGSPPVARAGGDWEAHTVVIDDERTRPVQRRRFTVRGMENRAVGLPVDSIRLELDSEQAA